jgi:hypothetical protein
MNGHTSGGLSSKLNKAKAILKCKAPIYQHITQRIPTFICEDDRQMQLHFRCLTDPLTIADRRVVRKRLRKRIWEIF